MDVDPFGTTSITQLSYNAFYLIKWNENKNHIWSRTSISIETNIPNASYPKGSSIAWAMEVDEDGNIYVVGDFMQTVDFGCSQSSMIRDAGGPAYPNSFILKLSEDGTPQWVQVFLSQYSVYTYDINFDPNGNILINGTFHVTLNLDYPSPIQINDWDTNLFIISITPDNYLNWHLNYGGDCSYSKDEKIAVSPEGDIYATGSMDGKFQFHPEQWPTPLIWSNGSAGFLLKIGRTAGLNEKNENVEFNLFPNPIQGGEIYFQSKEGLILQSISLIDPTGRQFDLDFNGNTIHLSELKLSQGIYFLCIETQKSTQIVQILIE